MYLEDKIEILTTQKLRLDFVGSRPADNAACPSVLLPSSHISSNATTSVKKNKTTMREQDDDCLKKY
jgi:hypothetical protein